ncbi:Glycosyltransferase involved in cell wall bisynthesis [Micromonospora siamensis]|uniref:Glycosyltransferase involved in cell wall bisynthesis n=2 Tax=Micromonospora siamensis TaxID=299152 RepID=A0A1C5HZB6_9ACTN|nr:Glycosyltransferase involved in cell wall bisynthesis [Micromonospora siamensis]
MYRSGRPDSVRVGVFVGHFIPAYRSGGPIRSLSAITAARTSGVTYTVFTRDRDAGDPQPFSVARPGHLVEFQGRRVMYVDITRPLAYLRALRRFVRPGYDIYYFNSLWNRPFTMVPLLLICLGVLARRPVLLAPRGELLAGALGPKAWRKRAGLRVMQLLLARVEAAIHCTSAEEVDSARRFLPARRIELVQDAFDPDERFDVEPPRDPEPAGPLRVCFFSRVHPHKNLAGALAALALMTEPVHLRVIGPAADEAYHRHCQDLAARLPGHIRVEFLGAVPHEQAAAALVWGHVFLLPTKGENFGHAIREAMAAGLCPVISDATQWTELVREAGGVALPWYDTDGFARHLSLLARCSPQELRALRSGVLAAYQAWARRQIPSPVLMDELLARLAGKIVAPTIAPGVAGALRGGRAC